jgi:chromosome segregation ATPase
MTVAAADADATNTQLRVQLDALREELGASAACLEQREAELCKLTASHDELDRRLSASEAALSASEAASRTIEQERDSLSGRLHDLQQQLSHSRQQMTVAAADADATNTQLRVQLDALREELGASAACLEQREAVVEGFCIQFGGDLRSAGAN